MCDIDSMCLNHAAWAAYLLQHITVVGQWRLRRCVYTFVSLCLHIASLCLHICVVVFTQCVVVFTHLRLSLLCSSLYYYIHPCIWYYFNRDLQNPICVIRKLMWSEWKSDALYKWVLRNIVPPWFFCAEHAWLCESVEAFVRATCCSSVVVKLAVSNQWKRKRTNNPSHIEHSDIRVSISLGFSQSDILLPYTAQII